MLDHARTVVMWNSSAGSAEAAGHVLDELRTMSNVAIREPSGRAATIGESLEAARDGAEVIVAAGGDGTVNSVVEGLMRSDHRPALGILPVGTGNDLARTLDLPLVPDEALETLRSAEVRAIDVVQSTSSTGTRWSVNMLTGGNTGRYLQQMSDELKRQWGPFCYLRGVVDVIRDLQTYRIQVACDHGPSETFDALNVFVANGRHSGGGLGVSPEAELDDGLLDLVIVCDGEPGEIAGLTSNYLLSDYLQHELIAFRRVEHLSVTSQPELPLTADGEEAGTTPLSVRVHQQRLRVLVPRRDG